MSLETAVWSISGYESLEERCNMLHDCLLELDLVTFDSATGIWKGVFYAPLVNLAAEKYEGMEVQRRWLHTVYRFSLFKMTLKFNAVREQRIRDRARIGTYSFNRCLRTPDACRLVFNEDMQIDLALTGTPQAELRNEGECGRGHIDCWAGIIYSGIVIDQLLPQLSASSHE